LPSCRCRSWEFRKLAKSFRIRGDNGPWIMPDFRQEEGKNR
jgi:hypothetical protein